MNKPNTILAFAAMTVTVACSDEGPVSAADASRTPVAPSLEAMAWMVQGGAATSTADEPMAALAAIVPQTDGAPGGPDCGAPETELQAEMCSAIAAKSEAPDMGGDKPPACPVYRGEQIEQTPALGELADACRAWMQARPEMYMMSQTTELSDNPDASHKVVSYVIGGEAPVWTLDGEVREDGPMMVDVYQAIGQVLQNIDAPVEVTYGPYGVIERVTIDNGDACDTLEIVISPMEKGDLPN
jgi:hypothetical protein